MFFRILVLLPFVSLAISKSLVNSSFDDFCTALDILAGKLKQIGFVLVITEQADSDIKYATNACPTMALPEDQAKLVLAKFKVLNSLVGIAHDCAINSRAQVAEVGLMPEVVPVIKSVKEDCNNLVTKTLKCTPGGLYSSMTAEGAAINKALQEVADAYTAK
ncbi:hypothetical protein IW261DRAFT_1562485 [Armillaria novae-zelandiae]|uniref:Cell wall galactomannoprotein n=1 Tax=Armillaria novae-zelandiae TaxID=153914 RepID=A0AA39PEN3_9AGAR|nr:hypothetical protein IW261DRAFT_1562485 [Armillaria novae-zelandiae]